MPGVHAAGFYDIFSTNQFKTVQAIQSGGGPGGVGMQWLIIEAGGHCAGGAINWTNASWGYDLAQQFALELFAEVRAVVTVVCLVVLGSACAPCCNARSRRARSRSRDHPLYRVRPCRCCTSRTALRWPRAWATRVR